LTVVELLLDVVLTLAAGAAFAGLLRLSLGLLERVLIAIVSGLVLGAAATFVLALPAGLNAVSVLLGPALVIGVCAAASYLWEGPLLPWSRAIDDARHRWSTRSVLEMVGITTVASAFFATLFVHSVYTLNGELDAGFLTVWADWSQHLTTVASFTAGSNLPPQNPLFSGTPLLYPFLPDFHSATLVALGLSPQAALAMPGAVLAVVITLLVVCLARRLGIGIGAGIVAAVIVFIGGGLGFIGVFGDACQSAGYAAAQCTASHVIGDPGSGLHVIGGTLHSLPGIIAAQPRAYDGLLTAPASQPLQNMQWYTPLFAWWLPQRTILYGFAMAACVFLVVIVAMRERDPGWTPFVLGGVLLGLLPLVHVQTLLAVALMLLVLALLHRRIEWLGLLGSVLVLGAPRLAQLGFAPHGSVAFGNAYPWLEPGWLSTAFAHSTATVTTAAAAIGQFFVALGRAISLVGNSTWWGFWFINVGVMVPLSALVVAGTVLAKLQSRAGTVGRWLISPFPAPLLEFALGGILVFAVCNLVVFQSWDWDNTKLLVYWYLTGALLVGALASHWWRRRWWSVASLLLVGSTVITGVVVLLRLLPWTPSSDSVGGPYAIATSGERAMAAVIERGTAHNAVFLTFGRPNDPVLAVAGRPGVMGYYGWLWSYGTDFGARYGDVKTMYRGCLQSESSCAVPSLLQKYNVSYVEIDDRTASPGAIEPAASTTWWAQQGYRVVARSADIVIYDVRH